MTPKAKAAPAAPAVQDRVNNRKKKDGFVVSNKMSKTIVVKIPRRVRHPFYDKIITKFTTAYVHDEKNEARPGDKVTIMETRPLSRLKRWRLVKVLQRKEQFDDNIK